MKLNKTYNHNDYESDIYDLWEKREAFKPTGVGEPFSIVLPPPNANAGLHIGHAVGFNIQDILIRYQRMRGRDALWLPGADHAGFETQVVYEKHLAKEGKSRFDFSRQELFDQIYDFVGQNKDNFEAIFRTLGASVDWSRFTFTLEDRVVETVNKTFKKLWDDGLIYRGERLVNYCTQHQTGFADIEVSYEERSTPLYYLKYGPFTVATTRPETKFGDVAIAVHPDDKRYKKYHGKIIKIDGLNGPFDLQVITDGYVDPNFGTGAVKITPAHDFNDWEVAERHQLKAIQVIEADGTLNDVAGEFAGMTVAEARKAVVKALEKKGLLEKVDDTYQNRVGTCYKCGTVIEPMLMHQWFINMQELAKPAIQALKDKKINFYPEQKRQQTIDYLETVRDWNISRQIAWGIPIPTFQNVNDHSDWVFDDRTDQETIEIDGKTYQRDPDVFDTWFSSGHWPFVTLNGPDGADFERYYPNALMETGGDILYPWVSRMIVLGIYLTGEVPFLDVYLHGMVRGEDGRKMSKSIGNVVDPLPLLEKYGSDAIRMGMIAGRSAGENAAYSPAKIVAGRNFCNKLWNIARFTEAILESKPGKPEVHPTTPADHWMLSKLQHTAQAITELLDEYRIAEAYETVYHFVWNDFADWYIEASKREINPGLLRYSLGELLKITHPFAPFVTETIWQTLDWTGDSLLIQERWPNKVAFDAKKAKEFDDIIAIVTEIRMIVSKLKLPKTSLYFTDVPFLRDHDSLISGLAKINGVHEVEDGKGLHLTATSHKCWLDVDRTTISRYATVLKKQLQEAEATRDGLQKRLDNDAYMKKAPKKLVDETKHSLNNTLQLIENITKEIVLFDV